MERNRNNLKRIIILITAFLCIVSAVVVVATSENATNISVDVATVETTEFIDINELINNHFKTIDYQTFTTSTDVKNAIDCIDEYCVSLRAVVQEISEAEPYFSNEIQRVEEIKVLYENDYTVLFAEEEKWRKCAEEYPEATQIWLYMKNEFEWTDTVCAGIIGNMMAECGGQTLAGLSNWDTNGSSGYGLIQWIGSRRKLIEARYGTYPTIEEQLLYMRDEMFGTNGVKQQISERQLQSIMNGESVSAVAANFAKYFERPASTDYSIRQKNAQKAYEYFVD